RRAGQERLRCHVRRPDRRALQHRGALLHYSAAALMDQMLAALSRQLGQALRERGFMLATAESCTGGWVAEVVTDTAGSSAWFERGFVTYSNQAKADMLGVRTDTLARFGAVSEETAQEMAAGAIIHSVADWAVAITGIAGPG